MATVDPNGSKCAAVPFNHLQRSTSCVTAGILLLCNDNRAAEIPAGASGLDGLAGKTEGRIKEERRFCLKCSSPRSFSRTLAARPVCTHSEKKP